MILVFDDQQNILLLVRGILRSLPYIVLPLSFLLVMCLAEQITHPAGTWFFQIKNRKNHDKQYCFIQMLWKLLRYFTPSKNGILLTESYFDYNVFLQLYKQRTTTLQRSISISNIHSKYISYPGGISMFKIS